jgi:anti-sigma regulatory factor (Ser/Thr protein kinase)
MFRCNILIRNNYAELQRGIREIDRALEAQKMTPEFIHMVDLALEEAITNTLKYGYDDAAEHQIEIALRCSHTELHIEVMDDGHEFNPLEHPEPDADKPLEEREPGGLGISFLRKLFDEVQYQRNEEKNLLILRKRLERV